MTASRPVDLRLAELLRASDRWRDPSVASGWLTRRAREHGIEITPREAFLMIVARRRRPTRRRAQ